MILDDTIYSASFANGSNDVIELGDEYFIGGLNGGKKKKSLLKGLRASEQSLLGCIRNVQIDKQSIGFPHFKVTQGLSTDCTWSYPCLEKAPCISSSVCEQHGQNEFNCYCDQAYCIKANFTDRYKIFTRSDLPIEMELLTISPVQLLEGDSIFLSTQFIEVLIEYAKFNIMESGVLFQIVQPPKHGRLTVLPTALDETAGNMTSGSNSKYFSLIDLSTDKIKYTHNSLEQFADHMTVDLQFVTSNREILPDFLLGKHRFVLHVNVTPVNDAPVLTIPSNKILRLTQGIQKLLTNDLLLVEDPDSPPESLVYSILVPVDSDAQYGEIEVAGKLSATFSQADINQGTVTYMINKQVRFYSNYMALI